jgi:hypothetical protein
MRVKSLPSGTNGAWGAQAPHECTSPNVNNANALSIHDRDDRDRQIRVGEEIALARKLSAAPASV